MVASAHAPVQVVVNKNAQERLEIFAHGADKALWHKWNTAPNNGGNCWDSFGGWIDIINVDQKSVDAGNAAFHRRSFGAEVRTLLSRRRGYLRYCGRYSAYFGAVAGACRGKCRTQSSPIIAPPLKGGEDFAGKSGRRTANACETSAMETNVIAAAHFMSGGLIKIEKYVIC